MSWLFSDEDENKNKIRLDGDGKIIKEEEDNSTTLSDEDMKKILAVTSYNIQEVKKWHSDFLKECPDGKLNKPHLQRLFKKVFPNISNADHQSFVDFIFRMFDTDKSNILEFREFLMVRNQLSRQNFENK